MEPWLALDGVSYAYGSEPVLDDVSLAVSQGEFVALVGPNGSGKSTLLRIAVGLLRSQRGTASLFGEAPTQHKARHRLGFVPQRPALAAGIAATVEDIAWAGRLTRAPRFGPRRRADAGAVERALHDVGLLDLRRARVRELSGGQQQRAFIARALAGEPDLLILDEPVAGVDAESQRHFRDSLVGIVRDRGGAVLLVSHELGAVASALDRVVVLKRSVRFDGPPGELTAQGVSLGVHAEDLPLWLEDVR